MMSLLYHHIDHVGWGKFIKKANMVDANFIINMLILNSRKNKGYVEKKEDGSMKISLLNVSALDSQSFWQSKHALIIQQEQRVWKREREIEKAGERHAEAADKTKTKTQESGESWSSQRKALQTSQTWSIAQTSQSINKSSLKKHWIKRTQCINNKAAQ